MDSSELFKKPSHKPRPRSTRALFSRAFADAASTSRAPSSDIATRVNPEIIKKITSIVCRDVPKSENNRTSLIHNFSKYGKIIRVSCNVDKDQAIIHFENHDQALQAKNKVSKLGLNKFPIKIFWKQPTTSRTRRKSTEREEKAGGDFNKSIESDARKPIPRKKEISTKKTITPSENLKPYQPDPSLLSLLATPASTTSEKYDVLNARDSLLRAETKHAKIDVATAKIYCGTCPDMCPEKERYGRQVKKQLHVYELSVHSQPGDNIVDHQAAVKEYSRSSADQEEPLSFELRPAPVLSMTMDYLICNVIDMLDSANNTNAADWFDFLWNRTRSIRKDITQQHLCNLDVVALVEKCARFHIFCGERLCEEDMMTFDQKINNENLTKCLQTLKHFYYDLSIKNIECPCEAEFRSYDILLNLSRGEILRDVQKFTPKIRKSAYVDLALKVLNTFSSNNFVKFFKLVRQAPFLHSCILHRYFPQIRTEALHVMVKAYCPSNHTIQFPIKGLMINLGFEDFTEISSFCVSHGLICSENAITLGRNLFSYPESAPVVTRAKLLIESKIKTSVGQIVSGSSLPRNPASYYVPYDSFTSEGFLKPEAYAFKGKSNKEITYEKKDTPEPPSSSPVVQQQEETNKAINMVLNEFASNIFLEVINSTMREISSDVISWSKRIDEYSKSIFMDLLFEQIREVCSSKYSEAKLKLQREKEIEETKRKKQESLELKICGILANELIADALQAEVLLIAQNEAKDIARLLSLESKERTTLNIRDELLDLIAKEMINQCCSNVYEVMVTRVQNKMKCLQKKIQTRTMRKYFKVWRHNHIINSRFKNATRTFPSAALGLTIREQSELLKLGIETLSNSQLALIEFRNHLSLDMSCLEKLISFEFYGCPLNISSILEKEVPPMFNETLEGDTCFWKMCLSLPVTGINPESIQWFEDKFTKDKSKISEEKNVKTLSLFATDICSSDTHFKKMGICAKSVQGCIENMQINNSMLYGTLGIVLVGIISHDISSSLNECKKRLDSILRSKPKYPAAPVAIVVIGENELDENAISQQLELMNDSISSYKIFQMSNDFLDPKNTKSLIRLVSWLGKNCPEVVRISSLPISEFLETHLFGDILMRICEDKGERQKNGFLQQDPNITIEYVNSSIRHMMSVENMGCGLDISWPPSEFCVQHEVLPPVDWNDNRRLLNIKIVLETLLLSKFPEMYSWDDACECIWQFVEEHKVDTVDNTDVLQRVSYLLERACRQFVNACQSEYEMENCEPTEDNIPWTDIILVVIDYLITSLYRLPEGIRNVYFVEDQIKLQKIPNIWLQATSVTSLNSLKFNDSIWESVKKRKLDSDNAESQSTRFKFSKSGIEIEASENAKELMLQTQEEKNRLLDFDKKLQHAEEETSCLLINENLHVHDVKISKVDSSSFLDDSFNNIQEMIEMDKNENLEFSKRLSKALLNDV